MGYGNGYRRNTNNGGKRYKSNDIARAWADQKSESGYCPANMSFEGRNFYSYATVIASIVDSPKGRVYLVSEEHYSSSTAQHLGEVRSAIRAKASFTVPGVSMGCSNLSDFPRIFGTWQYEAGNKVEESNQSREPKRSRLIVEAWEIVCKMQGLAEFFHLSLDEYRVDLACPKRESLAKYYRRGITRRARWDEDVFDDSEATAQEVFTRLMALRLGASLSPWMNTAANEARPLTVEAALLGVRHEATCQIA